MKHGFVHQPQAVTSLKTEASRKGVPVNDDIAELLLEWRKHTPYTAGSSWLFASLYDTGKLPYNPVPGMSYRVRPAAKVAGGRSTSSETPLPFGRHPARQNGEEVKVI